MYVRILMWVLLSMTGLGGCQKAKPEVPSEQEIPAVPVETLVLETKSFVETLEVSGVTEPIHEVKVAAEAPGRVLKAPFEAGQRIEKGALLLRVDARLDSARLNLLDNQLATARREYERTKMLAREGLATPQQLDQAKSAVENAQLSLQQARVGIGKTTVRAPMTGHVATKHVEEGEYVSAGMPLAHIVDYDTIVVRAAVPESDVRHVEESSEVEVQIPALDRRVTGVVARRGIVASSSTRTFPVEIHVPNAEREILPGMRARVIIPRKRWEDVVLVPREAILQGVKRREAMVAVDEEGAVVSELRAVRTGPTRGNVVVVREGLKPGDRLIVKGHRGIVDKTPVKVVAERGAEADSRPERTETAR